MTESSGGWYNTRKQYRSVAYGTWKVGGARQITRKYSEDTRPTLIENNSLSGTYNTISSTLRKNKIQSDISRKMGESIPNLSTQNNITSLRPKGSLPSSNTMDSTFLVTRENNLMCDCYSSTEYVEFTERTQNDIDSCNGNTVSEPIKAAFRADRNLNSSISSRRRYRLENSVLRAHQRSQSAGADAKYSLLSSPSTSDMKTSLSISRDVANSNAKFIRATKKFFRKIYTTATLPNKKLQSVSNDNFYKTEQFFVMRHRSPTQTDDNSFSHIDDCRVQSGYQCGQSFPKNIFQDSGYPDSGLDMDRSSTPDQSLESMTITSKSETSSESTSRSNTEISWNDLFEQLKREMYQMRERDAQILADLHKVESQIQSVKLSQMERSYNDTYRDKLGKLVPSLPI